MKRRATNHRLARCSKYTAPGTRPGTATTVQPVPLWRRSLSSSKSGMPGFETGRYRDPERRREGQDQTASPTAARTAGLTSHAHLLCTRPSPAGLSSPARLQLAAASLRLQSFPLTLGGAYPKLDARAGGFRRQVSLQVVRKNLRPLLNLKLVRISYVL